MRGVLKGKKSQSFQKKVSFLLYSNKSQKIVETEKYVFSVSVENHWDNQVFFYFKKIKKGCSGEGVDCTAALDSL